MAELENDDDIFSQYKNLPATEKNNLNQLIEDLGSKIASTHRDENGNIRVDYKSEIMAGKDVAQTEKIVSVKNAQEKSVYISSFLYIITEMIKLKSPSGMIFDNDQIKCPSGFYVENKDFKVTEVLKKSKFTKVDVVKDIKTGIKHVMKTIPISQFRKQELDMWIDLKDFTASLLMVRRENNKIHFHSSNLCEGRTLKSTIDNQMKKIDDDKIKGVSLCILHNLLSVVKMIHDKEWTHNDLHADNVIVLRTVEPMVLKIMDFGCGRRMTHEDGISCYQSDIWMCFRLFNVMFLGLEFENVYDVKTNGKKELEKYFSERLNSLEVNLNSLEVNKKILEDALKLLNDYKSPIAEKSLQTAMEILNEQKLKEEVKSLKEDMRLKEQHKKLLEENRKDIYQLYDIFFDITSADMGKTEKALENVSEVLERNDINKKEMLEHAAKTWFPGTENTELEYGTEMINDVASTLVLGISMFAFMWFTNKDTQSVILPSHHQLRAQRGGMGSRDCRGGRRPPLQSRRKVQQRSRK